MARPKRRGCPVVSVQAGTFVAAHRDLTARISADVPFHSGMPSAFPIKEGTNGVVVGEVRGEPGLLTVEFEYGDNGMVRVEVEESDVCIV